MRVAAASVVSFIDPRSSPKPCTAASTRAPSLDVSTRSGPFAEARAGFRPSIETTDIKRRNHSSYAAVFAYSEEIGRPDTGLVRHTQWRVREPTTSERLYGRDRPR